MRRLGAGGFGTVFKCKLDGQEAVAKQIAVAKLGAKDLPLLQNEVRLWAQLDHPNCIKFFGVIIDTSYYYLLCANPNPNPNMSFCCVRAQLMPRLGEGKGGLAPTPSRALALSLVRCELMPGGSLLDKHQRLRSQSKQGRMLIPVPQTPQLLADIRQVAGAMAHLHVKKILHRDLKSANVLYGGDLC